MKPLLLALVFLAGCAHIKPTSERLNDMHRAVSTVITAAMPLIEGACHDAAINCAEEGDELCAPLQKCDAFRHNFARSVVALYNALLIADVALAAGDEAEAWEAINKATEILNVIRDGLRDIGLRS